MSVLLGVGVLGSETLCSAGRPVASRKALSRSHLASPDSVFGAFVDKAKGPSRVRGKIYRHSIKRALQRKSILLG